MLQILNLLKPILADIFDVEESEITPATTFEELYADEYDITEIRFAIEEELDLTLDEKEMSAQASVGELIKLIEERKNA
ncbi:MAG: hypothetical protein IIW31_04445 [Clostridia bacterium]|nr:hypothetical protein [Clostridia bacterium]MBQ5820464.1 hypothetical protein [Clostridia bacterium]